MNLLGDGQFEIDGVTFGGVWDSVKLDKVEPPQNKWSTHDTENLFKPSLFMGSDLLRPGDWQFELRTDTFSIDEARDAAGRLAAAWLRGGQRLPGALSGLRYRLGDRTRICFGRGREFNHSFDAWSYSGTSPIVASFQMASPFFYEDEERSVRLGYTPPVTGGLTAPLEAPLVSWGTGGTVQGGYIPDVGGDAPTPFVVTIQGPTENAMISGDGWTIEYAHPIAYDEAVTIDCRFGVSVVYNNFGQTLNNRLSWKTNLTKAVLNPGQANIRYHGFDLTNTSYAVLRWRPAYHSY